MCFSVVLDCSAPFLATAAAREFCTQYFNLRKKTKSGHITIYSTDNRCCAGSIQHRSNPMGKKHADYSRSSADYTAPNRQHELPLTEILLQIRNIYLPLTEIWTIERKSMISQACCVFMQCPDAVPSSALKGQSRTRAVSSSVARLTRGEKQGVGRRWGARVERTLRHRAPHIKSPQRGGGCATSAGRYHTHRFAGRISQRVCDFR